MSCSSTATRPATLEPHKGTVPVCFHDRACTSESCSKQHSNSKHWQTRREYATVSCLSESAGEGRPLWHGAPPPGRTGLAAFGPLCAKMMTCRPNAAAICEQEQSATVRATALAATGPWHERRTSGPLPDLAPRRAKVHRTDARAGASLPQAVRVVQDLQELAVAVQDQDALGAAVDNVGRAEVAANGHDAGPAIGAADLPLHGGRPTAALPAALAPRR